jgi:hypothetical protein
MLVTLDRPVTPKISSWRGKVDISLIVQQKVSTNVWCAWNITWYSFCFVGVTRGGWYHSQILYNNIIFLFVKFCTRKCQGQRIVNRLLQEWFCSARNHGIVDWLCSVYPHKKYLVHCSSILIFSQIDGEQRIGNSCYDVIKVHFIYFSRTQSTLFYCTAGLAYLPSISPLGKVR